MLPAGNDGTSDMVLAGSSSSSGTGIASSDADSTPPAAAASELVAEAFESEMGLAEVALQAQAPPVASAVPPGGDAVRVRKVSTKAAVPVAPGRRGSARASVSASPESVP